MLWIIGFIGVLGLSGMTWFCPVFGAAWALIARFPRAVRVKGERGGTAIKELVVAIPAYNEAQALPRTLASIKRAQAALRSRIPSIRVRMMVGDDGSFDRTATIAAEFGAEVISVERSEGKWRMLGRLVEAAGAADTIVFADAGIAWPIDTLIRLTETASAPDVLGVAPAYRIRNGGMLSRGVWWLERGLKTLENLSGGPISVHGATVLYRTQPLGEVFKKLSDTNFLNDDVVIPLTLRRLFPQGRTVYLPSVVVTDEADSGAPERRRRARLMRGNLQWMVRGDRGDALTEIIAARRVFRLFWVYWLTAVFVPVIGAVVVAAPPFGIASLGVMMGALIFPWKPRPIERFLDAAGASFQAPVELLRLLRGGATSSGGTVWR